MPILREKTYITYGAAFSISCRAKARLLFSYDFKIADICPPNLRVHHAAFHTGNHELSLSGLKRSFGNWRKPGNQWQLGASWCKAEKKKSATSAPWDILFTSAAGSPVFSTSFPRHLCNLSQLSSRRFTCPTFRCTLINKIPSFSTFPFLPRFHPNSLSSPPYLHSLPFPASGANQTVCSRSDQLETSNVRRAKWLQGCAHARRQFFTGLFSDSLTFLCVSLSHHKVAPTDLN